MKYKMAKDGEWFSLNMKNSFIACCDCGLVHKMDFQLRRGHLYCRAKRAIRLTENLRRVSRKRGRRRHVKTNLA